MPGRERKKCGRLDMCCSSGAQNGVSCHNNETMLDPVDRPLLYVHNFDYHSMGPSIQVPEYLFLLLDASGH